MLFTGKQQLTICLIAAVLGAVFIAGRYLPLRSAVSAVRQTKAARTMEIAQGTADQRRLHVLRRQLDEIKESIDTYEAGITDQRALGVFLSKIADLMRQHELQGQDVTPGDEIQARNLKCIPVNIKCKGRFVHIFEFFQKLHNLDRFVRIENVKLTNDEMMTGRIAMETTAVIFYRPTSDSKNN